MPVLWLLGFMSKAIWGLVDRWPWCLGLKHGIKSVQVLVFNSGLSRNSKVLGVEVRRSGSSAVLP